MRSSRGGSRRPAKGLSGAHLPVRRRSAVARAWRYRFSPAARIACEAVGPLSRRAGLRHAALQNASSLSPRSLSHTLRSRRRLRADRPASGLSRSEAFEACRHA